MQSSCSGGFSCWLTSPAGLPGRASPATSWQHPSPYPPRRLNHTPLPLPTQVEPGSRIQLGRVLALKSGGKFSVGQPYMEGVTVEAEVLEELKGPKVRLARVS